MTGTTPRGRAHALFERIVDLAEEEREAALDEACAEDPQMRRLVESMVAADRAPHSLLDTDPSRLSTLLDEEDGTEPPGTLPEVVIGGYRLLREAGHGGMATVYLAERKVGEATQRVALKLVKRGIDTGEVLRRFSHETRVLASLEHPNIARFYDAGASEDGRPYLVMEYIEGRTLLRHCDEARLSIRQRLALFRTACDAVAYAHQRMVVHRDIKPSNILVTPQGDLKLLDFGIAKLLADEPDPEDALTRTGVLVLTPEYAAPEQLSGGPVSTSTDVYALGMVLFELLAGRRAHTGSREGGGPLSSDPTTPSTAVRRAAREGNASAVAAARRTSPEGLRRTLRGDLDRITLKALEQDPDLRYRSVEQLADDLDRYAQGLPVRARPQTVAYRVRKYVRRHRAGVVATLGAVALAMGAGWYHNAGITRARDRAELEAVKARTTTRFLQRLLGDAYPSVALGDTFSMGDLLHRATARVDSLSEEPDVQAELLRTLGDIYREQGHFSEALPLLERSVALHRTAEGPSSRETGQALDALGQLQYESGDYQGAIRSHQEALNIFSRIGAPDDSLVLFSTNNVAADAAALNEYDLADSLYRTLLARHSRFFADTSQLVHTTYNNLGVLHDDTGDFEEAEQDFREALRLRLLALPPDHPSTALTRNNLCSLLGKMGRLEEAVQECRVALQSFERVFGHNHPRVGLAAYNLGRALQRMGRLTEADSLLRMTVAIDRDVYGAANVSVGYDLRRLGSIQVDEGACENATATLREADDIFENSGFPLSERRRLEVRANLATCLTRLDRWTEAERVLLPTYDAAIKVGAEVDSAGLRATTRALAGLYEAWGRPADARRYESRLASPDTPQR